MNDSTLHTLSELARKAHDQAARLLAGERHTRQQLLMQMETLENYRNEYRKRLYQLMEQGSGLSTLQNYQRFLDSLNTTIAQAADRLNSQDDRVSRYRQEWQQKQRRLTSFNTLQKRHQQARNRENNQREQRLNDELSSRMHQYPGWSEER